IARQPAGARCGKPTAGNTHPDHAIGADSAIRLVAFVLGINAATDDPCCYAHGTAVPAQSVDRHTPSPVIGRPADPTRGIVGVQASASTATSVGASNRRYKFFTDPLHFSLSLCNTEVFLACNRTRSGHCTGR